MVKKTIVFAPATFNLAETTRMLEIAKVMRKKYDCCFFGFSKKYAEMIRAQKFSFTLLEPVFSSQQEVEIIRLDQGKGLKNPFTDKIVALRVQNELTFLAEQQPAVVVTGTNLTIFLSARIAKIPLVYVKPYALTRPYLRTTPSLLNRLLLKVRWQPSAFKKVAADYQFKLPKYAIDLLEGDQNLITTSENFYDTTALPENYQPVGPIFAQLEQEIPLEIQQWINKARLQEKPLVYFAAGSSANQKIVTKVLTALRQKDFYVLAPVKNYLATCDFGPQILCTDWLPAHLIAPLVDFSIIHGGEGTVQTACQSGKPLLGFGLQAEQKINLSYCEKYGNGLQIKVNEIGKSVFFEGLAAIQQPKYLAAAKKLQANFETQGAAKAAAWIEEFYL